MVGITNKVLLAEIRRQQQLSQSIVEGQTAISTGKTLNKPSDDALAWVQVSELGRAQAQQAAWQSNVSTSLTRSTTADDSLDEMKNLLTQAQELMTSARNGALNDTSRAAIVEQMKTIRTTIDSLLNQTDFNGVPTFDDGQSILTPVGRGLNLAVVGTKQDVSEGIDVNGTPTTLDAILAQSIAALESGNDADLSTGLDAIKAGQNHIILEQTKQGVRGNRLEEIGTRLTTLDIDIKERRDNLEATNLQEVISSTAAKLLQLDAAQASYARINQQTLFDLIK